jgi:hypothetical protein
MAEPRSRVFRQVVTLEVFWLVGPEYEPPFADLEAVVRNAISESTEVEPEAEMVPGEGSVSDVEELTPDA